MSETLEKPTGVQVNTTVKVNITLKGTSHFRGSLNVEIPWNFGAPIQEFEEALEKNLVGLKDRILIAAGRKQITE